MNLLNYIPDAAFRTCLESKGYIVSADNENVTITAAGLATTIIDVSNNSKITDLSGIDFFSALTTLQCNNCSLTTLNVSECLELKTLYCSVNSSLTTLTLPSSSTKLESLQCNECSFSSLDISGYSALTELQCFGNRLSSLNASTMANPNNYFLVCGQQTSDGSSAQILTLTLASSQKNAWNEFLKGQEYNSGVTLAD